MALTDSEHVLVSTFNPDVDTIEQAVTASDLRVGFWTELETAAARFADGAVVMLRACNRSGKPDLEIPLLEGRAEVLTEGPMFEEVRDAVADRFGKGAVGEGVVDNVKGLFGKKDTPAYVVMVNVTA